MFTFDYRDVSFSHKDGFTSSPKDEFHKHMHHVFEVIYFICGTVEFHVEDKSQKLSPGDVVLIQPGKFHFADVDRQSSYQRFVCKVPEDILPDSILKKIGVLGAFFKDCESLLPLFQDLDRFAEEFSGEEMRSLCLARMVEVLIRLSKKESVPLEDDRPSVAKDLVSYIEQHLHEKITLQSLADAFHYSTSYVATSFRKEMHVSLISYVRGKKVMAAHALIMHGMKPSEAAVAMGFVDYSTFFRSYEKMMGFSPSNSKKYNSAIELE